MTTHQKPQPISTQDPVLRRRQFADLAERINAFIDAEVLPADVNPRFILELALLLRS